MSKSDQKTDQTNDDTNATQGKFPVTTVLRKRLKEKMQTSTGGNAIFDVLETLEKRGFGEIISSVGNSITVDNDFIRPRHLLTFISQVAKQIGIPADNIKAELNDNAVAIMKTGNVSPNAMKKLGDALINYLATESPKIIETTKHTDGVDVGWWSEANKVQTSEEEILASLQTDVDLVRRAARILGTSVQSLELLQTVLSMEPVQLARAIKAEKRFR